MPLYKALELCPNLILHAVDKKFYNKISDTVMEILEKYADTFEQSSIDEAYLDCTNKISSDTNNLTVEEYAQDIKKSIKEKCGGLLTSIGIAPTKSIAKIASDYQKPDGLTIVPIDELKKFLNPLEVERIAGIGTKTQKILKEEMKINTIGDLANTDVQILIERFGKKIGTWMWQVANGVGNEGAVMARVLVEQRLKGAGNRSVTVNVAESPRAGASATANSPPAKCCGQTGSAPGWGPMSPCAGMRRRGA